MTLDRRLETVEARCEALQRSLSRTRRLLAVVMAVVSVGATAAFQSEGVVHDILRVRRLQLVGPGETPAVLADLFDSGDSGARFVMQNKGGHLLVVAGSDASGRGYLANFDGKGWPLVELTAEAATGGALVTYDNSGTPMTRLDADARRFGRVTTYRGFDRAYQKVARLGPVPSEDGGVHSFDARGAIVATWPEP